MLKRSKSPRTSPAAPPALPVSAKRFRAIIWRYYRIHGRAMPWRRTRDPYRILVSEVMLQQTQVARVMKFYPGFIKKFPGYRALAKASVRDVLRAWAGLGYHRRALALRELARTVVQEHGGVLPRERAALEAFPGIGEATAGSLRAFIWNEPEIFIETNIRRVFIHFFFPGRGRVSDRAIARRIAETLPPARRDTREWYWALMDYGAMLGRSKEVRNPNRRSAEYRTPAPFKGSRRELRGHILREVLCRASARRKEEKRGFGLRAIARAAARPIAEVRIAARALAREGFIDLEGDVVYSK